MYIYASTLCRVVTSAHVVLLAMELLDMNSPDDVPDDSVVVENDEERADFFEQLCQKIVSHVWAAVPQVEVDAVSSSVPQLPSPYKLGMLQRHYAYCKCKTGICCITRTSYYNVQVLTFSYWANM